jgi:hypothetical protein
MTSRIALITFLDGADGRPDNTLPGPGIPGYPSQGLPGSPGHPSQGLPWFPGRPDNSLPGSGGRPDNSLPGGGHPWLPGHIGFPPVAGQLPWTPSAPGVPAQPIYLPVYPPTGGGGDGSTKPIEGSKWELRWVPCVGFVLVPEGTPSAGNELPGQPTRPDQGLPPTPEPKKSY